MCFSNLCIAGKVKMENTKNKNENNGNQNVSANLQSGNYGNFLKIIFTCIEYWLCVVANTGLMNCLPVPVSLLLFCIFLKLYKKYTYVCSVMLYHNHVV